MSQTRLKPDVMLLAAGLGTRMRPITDTMPKPLVRVGGRALIDRVIEQAMAAGLTRFALNVHHHADQLIAHAAGLEQAHPGARFMVSHEDGAALGTGGGVKAALALLETDPVLVMNTDVFWAGADGAPIARMLERYAAGGAEMVLLCVHPRDAHGFHRSHDFCLDPQGVVTNDIGAPVIYAGAALVARSLFDATPDGAFPIEELLDRARDRAELVGVVLDTPWMHVGDAQGLAEAEALLETLP